MNDDPADELVDVVDVHDRVVGQVTRGQMRRDGARHRAVYVVVRTSRDEVVVHRRADWKDVFPGAWDLCFGGVLAAGERWNDAAVRELAEEAGVDGRLVELGGGTYEADGTAVVGRVYATEHDGPYPCPDGEVVEVRAVPRNQLADFVRRHEVCPDSVELVLPLLDSVNPRQGPTPHR